MAWAREMEPIPEEEDGDGREVTSRLRQVFTSEKVDTLVSTVPKGVVPESWLVESEEVVDPEMATTYITEGLGGQTSARGSSYTYTYESHYDQPPMEDVQLSPASQSRQTQKVTRLTKVTTTRSVRQVPVPGPYADVFFDAAGNAIPVADIHSPAAGEYSDEELVNMGIGLRTLELDGASGGWETRAAPPPAPSSHASRTDEALPGVPGIPQITDVDAMEVSLAWLSPVSSAALLGYQIELRRAPFGEWEGAHDDLLTDTQCTITNLDALGEYAFRVSAVSAAGMGQPSPSSTVVQLRPAVSHSNGDTALFPPSRPAVTWVEGDRATIEWAPPVLNTSSAPVAGYQVEYRAAGTSEWLIANDALVTETNYQITGLRPNGEYEFRVRARNADGFSEPSRSSGLVRIKPAAPARRSTLPMGEVSPPGQPLVVEADMDWVRLQWSPSAASEPISYVVELREIGDPAWYAATERPLPGTAQTIRGLRANSTYEFRVWAETIHGRSEVSEVSDVVQLRPRIRSTVLRGVPARMAAPEYQSVEGDRVSICWLPASSTLPVLGYDVEFRDYQQDAGWYKVNEEPVTGCKMTVGDLIVGHEYQFRVIAMNSVGYSEPSDPSPPVTIQPSANGGAKFIEAERFGAVRLLQEEMQRESPPLPDRDDSPPPISRSAFPNSNLQWRDPNLKEVIEYLGSPDKNLQLNASGYLQHLTYNDNLIKEETRQLGGIPKLIRLLASDSPEVQKNACGCLKNLAYGKENDANKRAIVESDGVRLLAALLQTTPDGAVKEEVTGALWNLSSTDHLKQPILEAAASPIVTQVIVPGSGWHPGANSQLVDPSRPLNTNLFRNGTGVLRNISASSPKARKILRDAPHLIESLLHFLSMAVTRNQVDSRAVENVVCLLRNLSYRIQEVEDPNYDPYKAHLASTRERSKSAPSGSPKAKKKKDKKEKKPSSIVQRVEGAALLWQPDTVRLYLKLLQDASNIDTLEASAGAIQNLAACQFEPSAQVRATVRVEKGLPVLVELIRIPEDKVVCAVATALRNLSVDARNRELIGKYAMRDLIAKLPEKATRVASTSDQTLVAVLGILFEVVRSSAAFTRDLHENRGTDRLRALAKAYPTYSARVCKYASQVLYAMWQQKECQDGFRRGGLRESDFYAGPRAVDHSATLSRPISSQGRERPVQRGDETLDDSSSPRTTPLDPRLPHRDNSEPLYASVQKRRGGDVDDSWV